MVLCRKHASFGTNVTEVLEWVANASAEAGLVYATDAATNSKVAIVAAMPEAALKSQLSIQLVKLPPLRNKNQQMLLNFYRVNNAENILKILALS